MSSAYVMKIGIYSVVKAYIWNDFWRVLTLDWNVKSIFRTYFYCVLKIKSFVGIYLRKYNLIDWTSHRGASANYSFIKCSTVKYLTFNLSLCRLTFNGLNYWKGTSVLLFFLGGMVVDFLWSCFLMVLVLKKCFTFWLPISHTHHINITV